MSDQRTPATLGTMLDALEAKVRSLDKEIATERIACIIAAINKATAKYGNTTGEALSLRLEQTDAEGIDREIALLGSDGTSIGPNEYDEQDLAAAGILLSMRRHTHDRLLESIQTPVVTATLLLEELHEHVRQMMRQHPGMTPSEASVDSILQTIDESMLCSLAQTDPTVVWQHIRDIRDVRRLELVPGDVADVRKLIHRLDEHLVPIDPFGTDVKIAPSPLLEDIDACIRRKHEEAMESERQGTVELRTESEGNTP